ncbi:unnamed protein product [Parascedosporium putredinis]|uniref:Secreted protein n=1 Tax=Parascedosporium putredinis TaxID=1442378 RepID=A0A9P1M7E6_9PEZI|nr:unnamed protein product [Parascedosporium putredinis]CAI7991544.1 unnamed protein product [Parascedosporium putredinis]
MKPPSLLLGLIPTVLAGVASPIVINLGGSRSIGITADGDNANLIQIVSVTTSGRGCPAGSVATIISTDRTVVTLGYDNFRAYIGPSPRSTCSIRLRLKYPGGHTISLVQTTFHGFAVLDPGVSGTFESRYAFGNAAQSSLVSSTIESSPESMSSGEEYMATATIPDDRKVYSPCGEEVDLVIQTNINLRSRNETGSGSINDENATVALTQQVNLAFEPCVE